MQNIATYYSKILARIIRNNPPIPKTRPKKRFSQKHHRIYAEICGHRSVPLGARHPVPSKEVIAQSKTSSIRKPTKTMARKMPFNKMQTRSGHRKLVKHDDSPGDAHELTFSCYRRLPLLRPERRRQLLADAINAAMIRHRYDLLALVFMPEHVHLLVLPTRLDR